MLGPHAPQPYVSSIQPIPTPTAVPPMYCIPSNIPAAVAAAFFPPKSIEAVPESMEWTMLIAKELRMNAPMIHPSPGEIQMIARQHTCRT